MLAIARRYQRLSLRREAAFAVAGIALAIHFATWIASLSFTSVAVATLLVTTTPLWTELYDIVRERRPPSFTYIISLILAFAGVSALALARTPTPPPVAGHALLGDALALIGSIAIGAYLLIVRDAARNDGVVLGTRQIVARTYGWAALALVLGAGFAHEGPPALGDGTAWGGILAMAFISQLLGHTAFNAALRDFSPTVISMATLLEPVVAALLAAALFREALSFQAIIGGALVLAAVAVTLRNVRANGSDGKRVRTVGAEQEL